MMVKKRGVGDADHAAMIRAFADAPRAVRPAAFTVASIPCRSRVARMRVERAIDATPAAVAVRVRSGSLWCRPRAIGGGEGARAGECGSRAATDAARRMWRM
ncbi:MULTISPECIES: hypothetical protein [Burkholderia]|uniref:Uncharacterized protein n=1 Tax=Burkholderia anthina TaxID=179879 RepID=A0ABS2B7E3_9BURK|nr:MULTISPECIES: hypothetical protein [Burkholderia]MBM2768863.1 hypothetical protein [Burkholderia anthina]